MNAAVVVVGPMAISGPGAVDPELAAIALDCIDDELALVDDLPLAVDAVWRDVLASAMGGDRGVVLVHPSWWSASRVRRVRTAAGERSGEVVVLPRAETFPTASAVVELSPELVVVHGDGWRRAIARGYPSAGVLEAVAGCLDGLPDVVIDAPAGIASFGAVLARMLRERGVAVTVGDDRAVIDAAGAVRNESARRRRVSPRAAAVVAAVASASGLAAAAVDVGDAPRPTIAVAWVVEGRVAVEVPAQWTIERITSGPGSARVQVAPPGDRATAIHVTQSRVPDAQTLAAAAESMRTALAVEPVGVFVDFVAAGTRAGRAAITYREVRADRLVDWTVLLDGGVRIAIGCQGLPRQNGPDDVCDRAIGSAHAVSRK